MSDARPFRVQDFGSRHLTSLVRLPNPPYLSYILPLKAPNKADKGLFGLTRVGEKLCLGLVWVRGYE